MKIVKVLCGVVGLLIVTFFYIVWVPTHGRSLGVSITARGFQTNTAGQVAPLYAISNHSERTVFVIPAIERRPRPNHGIDMMGNTQRLLAAHEEILVAITNTPPQRAAVHCQRERYFRNAQGIAKRSFDTYVFYRKETEMVYAP